MAAAAEPSNDTDALGGTNPSDAPALALANLYMATSQALSIAVHNAANIQQQVAITAQSALTMALSTLFSLDTAAAGEDKAKALKEAVSAAAVTTTMGAPGAELSDAVSKATLDGTRQSVDPMLSLVTLTACGLAMLDAAQHVQRTSVVSEAATAMALTRAGANEPGDWQVVIDAAERTLTAANQNLASVCHIAIEMTNAARGR